MNGMVRLAKRVVADEPDLSTARRAHGPCRAGSGTISLTVGVGPCSLSIKMVAVSAATAGAAYSAAASHQVMPSTVLCVPARPGLLGRGPDPSTTQRIGPFSCRAGPIGMVSATST